MPIKHDVSLTLASSSDAALLARLHTACFAKGWDEAAFAGLLADAQVTAFAGERAGHPVGFVVARAVAGEAEILALGVLPGCRKGGVGLALVSLLQAWAIEHEAGSIFLEVRESNTAALALYRKAGFRHVGLRKDYYRNDDGSSEHAVVMRYSKNA